MFFKIKKIFTEYKELKFLAYHDSLTGLLNRNWLYKNINSISCKYVFFIDINNLTKINKAGHTEGDKHIKNCVKKMTKDGILVRYAGDEFILFSNNKNAIISNQLFCVGKSIIKDDNLLRAINKADFNMIKNKKNEKFTNY